MVFILNKKNQLPALLTMFSDDHQKLRALVRLTRYLNFEQMAQSRQNKVDGGVVL